MKRARIIFRCLLLTLAILLALAYWLPKTEGVKHFLGKEIAAQLSKDWNTEVAIEEVCIDGLLDLKLKGIKVSDQQHRPMLTARQIGARLSLVEMLKGNIRIYAAVMDQPQLQLYTDEETPNYQFLIDALSKQDNDKPTHTDLKIANLKVNNGKLSLKDKTEHWLLTDIQAQLSIKELTDSTLRLNTRHLALKEAKGFTLNDATFRLIRNGDTVKLENASFQLPHSTLNGDATIDRDQFHARIQGDATPADFQRVEPKLKDSNRQLKLSLALSGDKADTHHLNIEHITLADANGLFYIEGSGSNRPTGWQAVCENMRVDAAGWQPLAKTIQPFANIPEELMRLGSTHASGTAAGKNGNWELTANLDSDAGNANIQYNTNASQQIAHVTTTQLNIGRLLQNSQLGTLAGQAELTYIPHSNQQALKAELEHIAFRNYDYRDVTLEGLLSNAFEGQITVDDPNIQAQADINNDGIKAHVDNANFKALRLTNALKDGIYSLDLTSNLNKDPKNGFLQIDNIKAFVDDEEIRMRRIRLDINHEADYQQASINADFGNIQVKGNTNMGDLTSTLASIVAASLPTMPGLPNAKATNSQFQVNGKIADTRFIQKVTGLPLNIKLPATIDGTIDGTDNRLELDLTLPELYYNNRHYKDGLVHITAKNSRISTDIQLKQLHENGKNSQWEVQATAENNQLKANLAFQSNQLKGIKGEIHTLSTFSQDENQLPTANIQVLPSDITIEDSLWKVHPANIVYNKNAATIDNFEISHHDQHIKINGKTTRNSNETIAVDLNDVDVAYILNLLNFHAVQFGGKVTGKAQVAHLYEKPEANAQLNVNNFQFETGRMGTLKLNAKLNNQNNHIEINAQADDGPFHKTNIQGFIAPTHNDILLAIDAQHTPVEFLQKLCGSFMDKVDMTATGHVDLVGPLNDIGLIGQLQTNGSFLMKPLGTIYRMNNCKIDFQPYAFQFQNDTITDTNDNYALLAGTIRHRNLGHLQFDLKLDMKDFQVYNFPDYHNNTFSGEVYTNGTCRIEGTEKDMFIDFHATPTNNSTFVYNASTPDVLNQNNFITWFDATHTNDDDNQTTKQPTPQTTKLPTAYINQNTKDINISGDLHVNFLINTNTNNTLKVIMDEETGDYIALNGSGILRASYYNNGPFHIYGNYLVDHGVYKLTVQNIIKKDFHIQQGGNIAFGGEPYEAPINLQANYTVNGVSLADLHVGKSFANNNIRVNCLMNITGTPNTPKIDFGLEFPSLSNDAQNIIHTLINSQEEMNQQVLYLLAIGRFYTQGSNNADSQNDTQQSQTALAMQSILSGTISQQINNILNTVVNNNNWNFGANISTGDEGWNNAEYEGTLSGRMLNNRLIFNGQFGYRDNNNATTSFIGDFNLQYLLFPNGNLAINVYNQTSDRYFTKNSLNTQGVGLILKKDFTSWRELLGIKTTKRPNDQTPKQPNGQDTLATPEKENRNKYAEREDPSH